MDFLCRFPSKYQINKFQITNNKFQSVAENGKSGGRRRTLIQMAADKPNKMVVAAQSREKSGEKKENGGETVEEVLDAGVAQVLPEKPSSTKKVENISKYDFFYLFLFL